jgi:hypothetical protein
VRKVILLLSTLALTDCAAQTVYLRTDGQDIASNPALAKQLDLDRIVCLGDLVDNQSCMAVKGYVSVSKDQAAAKQQQLAAIAAENAEHEAVASLPSPRPKGPHKNLAAKKQKSNPPDTALRSSQD